MVYLNNKEVLGGVRIGVGFKDRGTGESYIEIEYIRIAIFLIFFIYFTNNS